MTTWLPVLGLALAVGAPAPKVAPKKTGPPSIVGEWECESMTGGGKALPAGKVPPFVFEFLADGKFLARAPAGLRPEGKYTADPAKDPAEVDFAAGGIANLSKAIYKVEKDTLTLCFTDGGGGDRPTKFESPVGTRIILMTFKRVEKKKE